eukprot:TRINITY_DN0_c2371_g1_i1.p1 TRINITY_DN0_c2371_g1~~TRINITY_DN0_c2371_g1_i1.p1  ORF type:complete len:113 (-),score=18.05 TRINITY_DN0_c2371_g1_i1:103-441(-)
MGNSLFRNRFWYYRSLYDDYCGREMRLAYGIAGILWIPGYLWGVHMNREIEVYYSHKNYMLEYLPRRNRLAHSLLFEEFEVILERWSGLEARYAAEGKAFLDTIPEEPENAQ